MKVPVLFAIFTLLLVSTVARGDDWPQWMGPGRDNVWRESGVLERFPDGGPTVVWRTSVAGGYAGPAVAQGRVFVTDYVTGDDVKVDNFERNEFTGIERVLCLEEATGKLLWKHEYPVRYTVSYPAGPRCTPTVDGGRVYTLGTEGNLHCFDVESGRVVWSRDFPKEYGTKSAMWGYASHPLVDGQQLICIVGGEGSHVVAFDKESGKELWRALTSKEQGYSPPTIIQAGGVRQLVLLRPDAVTSVDPASGKQYWSVPYQASNGSIIMSPLRSGDLLYAAGYSDKNLLLRLSADQPAAEVVWRDLARQAISPVNVQPFLQDDTLYGFDQNGTLYGVDLASGERLWESNQPLNSRRPVATGTAFIVKQGERFWMFNELGELLITKLTRDGFQELDRAKVIEPTNLAFGRRVVWCPPAYANRRVYMRNDNELICVDVSAEDREKPERIPLWNGRAPVAPGEVAEGEAWITVHRPEKPNGAAIVICPGGGYGGLVTGAEGHGIAAWLNRHGITGVVLEYRLPAGRPFVPLLDAQRAIRTVRARAPQWQLDPARIGIMGFSAGGHLASTAATHFDKGAADSDDPIERLGCRPDFAILVYPVISMGPLAHGGSRNNLLGKEPSSELIELFSNEQQVTAETPPIFMAHALDDKPVPVEHSRTFHAALQAKKVPSRLLELPSGGHGLNGYKGPMWDAWQTQSIAWLDELKLMPSDSDKAPSP